MSRLRFVLVLFALVGGGARADEPLPPPEDYVTCSASGAYCARVALTPPGIVLTPADAPDTVLWSVPLYARRAIVADDGLHVVLGPDGANLVPWPPAMDQTMLTFLREGKVVREVPLRALIGRRALGRQRTVSHAVWGYVKGIGTDGRLAVETSDGRRLSFDVTTGRRVGR